jgi:hypothetical protein
MDGFNALGKALSYSGSLDPLAKQFLVDLLEVVAQNSQHLSWVGLGKDIIAGPIGQLRCGLLSHLQWNLPLPLVVYGQAHLKLADIGSPRVAVGDTRMDTNSAPPIGFRLPWLDDRRELEMLWRNPPHDGVGSVSTPCTESPGAGEDCKEQA